MLWLDENVHCQPNLEAQSHITVVCCCEFGLRYCKDMPSCKLQNEAVLSCVTWSQCLKYGESSQTNCFSVKRRNFTSLIDPERYIH